MPVPVPGRNAMLATMSGASQVDEEQLMARLKTAVFKSRARMREFFADYDPLRSGTVSEAKFRTALEASKVMHFREEELLMLTQMYKKGHLVAYEPFLRELDSVFTTREMERDPGAFVPDFTASLAKPPPNLPQSTMSDVDHVLRKISHIVKTRGLLIRPPFADFATNVNSPKLTEQARFAGAAPNYVDYVAFACAVDHGEALFSTREPRSTIENALHSGFRSDRVLNGTPTQPGRPPTAADAPTLVPYASPQLDALITKLQDNALKLRLRLGEFFRDFDKHNNGTVTLPQMASALSVAYKATPLSENEVVLLASHYGRTMADGGSHIQWRKLVGDVDAVFNASGLRRQPQSYPETRFLQQDPMTLDGHDEVEVHELLDKLRSFVSVRRVLVKPLFQDYEHQVNSAKVIDHITRAQTVQAFSRLGIDLSKREMTLLFRRYNTLGDATVNYVAIVRDIDPYESFSARETKHHALPQDPQFGHVSRGIPSGGFVSERVSRGALNTQPGRPPMANDMPGSPKKAFANQMSPARSFSPNSLAGSLTSSLAPTNAGPNSVARVLERLSTAATRHRVRIEEAFRDFDRHRDGTITVPQFSIGLQTAWGKYAPVSENELQLLVAEFAVPKPGAPFVYWKRFCEAVNGAPRATTMSMPPTSAVLSADVAAELEAVLARFRHICKTRRTMVRPFFDDMQASRRSMNKVDHVTRVQFAQCLSSLQLETTSRELEILQAHFDDLNDGHVNYVAFARAIDPSEEYLSRDDQGRIGEVSSYRASGGFMASKVQPAQPGRTPLVAEFPRLMANKPAQLDLNELLKRLQLKAKKFHISLEDFFVDHDRHRRGVITLAQFRAGMDRAFSQSYVRADLTAAEMATLEAAYAVVLNDGGEGIAYRKLCSDVDVVLTLPGLEYAPQVPVEDVQRSLTLRDGPAVSLPPNEEFEVADLLERIRAFLRVRHVYAKAPFEDFAKSANSPLVVDHVTRQQFVQGLGKLGVDASEAELALLFRKFDDAGDGTVNYVAFCHVVDEVETFSSRQQEPSRGSPLLSNGFRKPNSAYAGAGYA